MNAKDLVERVADELVRFAAPGTVVLVDREFFTPLVNVLQARANRLQVSVRTARFGDPVELLSQVLVSPRPSVACCPVSVEGDDCESLRKAHMLLEQAGIRIIETHVDSHHESGQHEFLPKPAAA